jgi:general secretion pathway protein C
LQLRFHQLKFIVLTLKLLCILISVGCLSWAIFSSVFSGLVPAYAKSIALETTVLKLLNTKSSQQQPSKITRASYKALESTTMFGALKNPKSAVATPTPVAQKKQALVPLELIGTFIASPHELSYAIIENKSKQEQEVFLAGDSVFDSADLVQISARFVKIKRDNKEEILRLDITDSDSPSPPSSEVAGLEQKIDVAQSDLDEALANLPVLLTQARTVPYFTNGKRDGLRLFAIRAGSFYEKIGLKNGDILKTVNDNELNDPANALQIFEKLKSERNIAVKVNRNRQDLTLRYEIK